jgi:uncharacterized Zn-binding protein involved in type VI secretion
MNWLVKGLLIGAAIAVAGVVIAGTGGLAGAAIIAGAAAGGAGIGELMSTMSWAPKEVAGAILGACSANVFTNGRPAARAHLDVVACIKHPATPPIATGSGNVYINSQPAARVSDKTGCGGDITDGSGNVNIGGGTQQTDPIHPEDLVPGWIHAAILVVGVGAAIVLAGPVVAVAGLIGGLAGGAGGAWIGGKLWGEGSDGQKWAMLGGSLIGGALGTKGGAWFDRNYAITTEGLGSNLGNVRIRPRAPNQQRTDLSNPPEPVRGSDGRFIARSESPAIYNRSTQYPKDYRAGVVDEVLDAHTIQSGPHAGKIRTGDGEIVARADPRITIEHNRAVVDHWNEVGYNSSRSVRNDFYNDTSNMSIRLKGANSSDGGRMSSQGIRYRQDTGPNYSN